MPWWDLGAVRILDLVAVGGGTAGLVSGAGAVLTECAATKVETCPGGKVVSTSTGTAIEAG